MASETLRDLDPVAPTICLPPVDYTSRSQIPARIEYVLMVYSLGIMMTIAAYVEHSGRGHRSSEHIHQTKKLGGFIRCYYHYFSARLVNFKISDCHPCSLIQVCTVERHSKPAS